MTRPLSLLAVGLVSLAVGGVALALGAREPVEGLAAEDVAVAEGNRGSTMLAFTVLRTGPADREASVAYVVEGETASPGTDFTPIRGRLSLRPGIRRAAVRIAVRGDVAPEPDETLRLILSDAVDARVARKRARGTVLDDDARAGGPLVAAAGDVACDPVVEEGDDLGPEACRAGRTADLLDGQPYVAVLALGDLQYELGSAAAFQDVYDRSWGRFKALTRPALGNHEYGTAGAAGYFAYFGAAAGPRPGGWYSFDVGDWHLVALNSNCGEIGGCGAGSAQGRWLRADLAAHPARCTLAFWHHPRFTSGLPHDGDAAVAPLWQALEDAGAELVLVGHAHQYERFRPQTAAGVADPRGIRELVVGTGGRNHYGFGPPLPNSVVRDETSFGILELELGAGRYSWRFRPAGGTFTDGGSADCH